MGWDEYLGMSLAARFLLHVELGEFIDMMNDSDGPNPGSPRTVRRSGF